MLSKLSSKIKPNPKLEALRKEGLKPPATQYDINQIIQKTKTIHAGWLFDFKHLLLLQKLCRLLDGNHDTFDTPGWGMFGHHLGLSSEILKVIECSKLGYEGYTYYVLLHYVQKSDSTIQKIIQALQNIKRFDVIHQTQSYFHELAELLKTETNEEDSGIFMNSTTTGSGDFSENRDPSNIQVQKSADRIISPKCIPIPPLVLREIQEKHQCTALTTTIPPPNKVENEQVQTSNSFRITYESPVMKDNFQTNQLPVAPRYSYDCIVLLTFTTDGINFATQVAKTLREKREDGLVIGVLVLYEHERRVQCDPISFINGSFLQVDYVVPIITEGYLKACMDTSSPMHIESLHIDCKYVRFIYSLMNKYYVRNGCLNKKIRCVIPDDLTHLTNKTLMKEPIFETWVKLSSVHKLAERMLGRCVRKRNCQPQTNEV